MRQRLYGGVRGRLSNGSLYSIEGFKWLSRLANMSLGGCLADDMGLGKTLQTISLLLNEAESGPCLVIAPASVCNVWEEECQKFAPSLNCIRIPDTGREKCIKSIKKMDLLIISYGMIYQVEKALINKKWEAVYIDDLNLELIGSNLEAADFLQDSYQINDYGKVKYESVASSIFLNFLEKKLYRTLSVKELPDGEFEVSGMEYNFQKFKSVDENESLRTPYFPIPPQADMSVPDSPSDLDLEDNTYRGVFK